MYQFDFFFQDNFLHESVDGTCFLDEDTYYLSCGICLESFVKVPLSVNVSQLVSKCLLNLPLNNCSFISLIMPVDEWNSSSRKRKPEMKSGRK